MYAHSARFPIRQPPHTAGKPLKGFRTAIDPAQVPSPVDAIEADRDKWDGCVYTTLPGERAPLSTTEFVALDQGNCSPRYIRPTTWAFPSSQGLARECDIPLAAIIHPFADQHPLEEVVPVVATGPTGPVRCTSCKGYLNPWCTFLAGGASWKCNLCAHQNNVEPEYFCNLDPGGVRLDALQRPELSKGAVDFVVTSEAYKAPQPQPRLIPSADASELLTKATMAPTSGERKTPLPMDFVFVFDLSLDGVRTGFLRASCETLLDLLYGEKDCFPSLSRLAIITFDSAVHFYDLSPGRDVAHMLVVPDIDDMFVPALDGLFVKPFESRTALENLLQSLANTPEEATIGRSAFGGALGGVLSLLRGRGGQVIVFQSSLSDLGPGALTPRTDESSMYDSDKEKQLFAPRDRFWVDIGEDCAEEGIGISMFLGMSQFADVGSIGTTTSLTGGDLFFHPRFESKRDIASLHSQLRRLFTRTTGYNCIVRIRSSSGVRVTGLHGNLHRTSADELTFGVLHADAAFSVSLSNAYSTISHSYKLDTRGQAHIQCAALYTTPQGERRVRVLNLALTVADLAGNVFRYADMDAVVSHLSKEAMTNLSSRRMEQIREELSDRCASILLGYRKNCAAATAPSQLILPEAFKALPMYILGLLKSKPLKTRIGTSDVRNYHAHRIRGMSAQAIMNYLYPRLLALHDLDDAIALPDSDGHIAYPAHMRASYVFMEAHGIYLIDNEEMCIIWVGLSVSPAQVRDLFGVDDVHDLSPLLVALPELPTRLSQQVRNVLAERAARRGGRTPRLLLARQNTDGTEIEFGDMLVEDENGGALTYLDYLCQVHKQIHTVLTQGGSIAGSRNLQGTPW